jgi:transcription elongation factor Elf1
MNFNYSPTNVNFTPLDQAYQIHHVNPNTYSSLNTARYSHHCMFCGSQNSVPLMESQDRGAFRQCINSSCRKQFQATILSQPVPNYQMSTQIQTQTQTQSPEIKNPQIRTQEIREKETRYEPHFISKFKTNY